MHRHTLIYLLGVARTTIFRQDISFLPNNFLHLRLCQHWSSISRMQLRPSE